MKPQPPRPRTPVFRTPVVLAAITLAGLVAGLAGDGTADALAWLGLLLPLLAIGWFLRKAA
jgi:hypothetical protein